MFALSETVPGTGTRRINEEADAAKLAPAVLIVVLNWNNATDTLSCLLSLSQLQYESHRVIVVDNGSTDDSVARIRADRPDVMVVEAGENLGYAGGNNLGIRRSLEMGADYVWLLNDDVVVDPDALNCLMRVAAERPNAGFLGPVVRMSEQPGHILSAGGSFDVHMVPEQRGVGERDGGQYREETEVDFLSGCALLVSRTAVERIGMLDERFFTYGEDVEWCYRGKLAGFGVVLVPQAIVWHPDTRRRDESSARVMYYITRNRLLFLRKHRLGMGIMLKELWRCVVWLVNWSVNPKWRGIRPKRDAVWLALRDFVLGRAGKSMDL